MMVLLSHSFLACPEGSLLPASIWLGLRSITLLAYGLAIVACVLCIRRQGFQRKLVKRILPWLGLVVLSLAMLCSLQILATHAHLLDSTHAFGAGDFEAVIPRLLAPIGSGVVSCLGCMVVAFSPS